MDAIIGYLVALVLSMLGMIGFTTWAKNTTTNVQTALTSSQMMAFDKAALLFVEENEPFLVANTTSTKAYVVTANQLVNGDTGAGRSGATGGYLPSSFTATNVFGQTWNLYVVQPNKGSLQALTIAQGGKMISDQVQLMQIAAQAGAQGGFVPVYPNSSESRNLNIDQSMTPDYAYGTSSGWKVKLQGSGTDIPYPGNGHLVSLLSFTHFTDEDYLYRVPQAPSGHPELNQMQTNLGMTDIANTPHKAYGASAYMTSDGGGLSTANGDVLDLGGSHTQAGTGNPSINFHLGGRLAQPFNVQMINDGDGHLLIKAAGNQASLQVEGTLETGHVATSGGGCNKTGLIATDASGLIYSCVNGIWTSQSQPPLIDAVLTKNGGTVMPLAYCPNLGGTLIVRTQTVEKDPNTGYWTNSTGSEAATNIGIQAFMPKASGGGQITYQDPTMADANLVQTAVVLVCSSSPIQYKPPF